MSKKQIVIIVMILFIIFTIYLANLQIEDLSFYPLAVFLHNQQTHNEEQQQSDVITLKSKCYCQENEQIHLKRVNSSLIKVNRQKTGKIYSIDLDELTMPFPVTCDLYKVLRRGMNQRIIGLSLYGNKSIYYRNLNKLSIQVKKFYPEWTIRVYSDFSSINQTQVCEHECLRNELDGEFIDNMDFCDINQLPVSFENKSSFWSASYMHSMQWRWFPIGDLFVDYFGSRDSDSLIIQREVDSVNEWLNSTTIGHIMRDNPNHSIEILGGMWSFANLRNRLLATSIFKKILDRSIAVKYNSDGLSPKGGDQYFLKDHVWPLIKSISTIHDSYLCGSYGGQPKPFPTQRASGNCFVGCADIDLSYTCCNENITYNECPIKCRPKEFPSWTYC